MNPEIQLVAPVFTTLRNTDTLYRIDGYGERFYYRKTETGIDFYGSVTSIKKQVTPTPQPIIDKMIQMGRDFEAYRNEKAEFGTFWHIQAADMTQNMSYDFTQLETRIAAYAAANPKSGDTSWWFQAAWKGLLAWAQCMQDYQIRPLAIEIPLWHPEGFAGTIDLPCTMYAEKYTEKTPESQRKRINAIIDWKTGDIYPDHAIQLELNKMAWEFHFPEHPIQGLYNFSPNDWRKAPGYEFRNQTAKENENIPHYLAVWQRKGERKPGNRKVLTADRFDVVTQQPGEAYLDLTIEEWIERKDQQK